MGRGNDIMKVLSDRSRTSGNKTVDSCDMSNLS